MNEGTVELIFEGNQLISELDALRRDYHVQSDQHDILSWEVDVVRARVRDLQEQCGLPDDLQDSVLLCDWGYRTLAKTIPELTQRVARFHACYNEATGP